MGRKSDRISGNRGAGVLERVENESGNGCAPLLSPEQGDRRGILPFYRGCLIHRRNESRRPCAVYDFRQTIEIPVFLLNRPNISNAVRELLVGDEITVCGVSRKAFSIWRVGRTACIERAGALPLPESAERNLCRKDNGYKCRECSGKIRDVSDQARILQMKWYEVPPGSRRHLAKPAVRMKDDI